MHRSAGAVAMAMGIAVLVTACSQVSASPSQSSATSGPPSSATSGPEPSTTSGSQSSATSRPSTTPSAGASLSASPLVDPLRARAESVLAAWEAKVDGSDQGAAVLIGELTGQTGSWEKSVGDNNKRALMAGLVKAAAPMPDAPVASGTITWPDGSSQAVVVQTAAEAFAAIIADGAGRCRDCQPIVLDQPTLDSVKASTSRGPATVPAWYFPVRGSANVVTRVAVANRVEEGGLPLEDNGTPFVRSIDRAIGRPSDSQLVVAFVGAPGPASEPCGADYTAEAVESDLAIAVIVREQRHPGPDVCLAVGAPRTASVSLAAPLGNRVVLEIRHGQPVPVTTQ